MDQWATTSSGGCGSASLAEAVAVMKASLAALKSLLPVPNTLLPWGPLPLTPPRWARTITVYAYPADRWCAYSASDYEWTRWCKLGRFIRVEYDEETKEVTKLPSGWVLPDDWFYGSDGSREPLIRYINWFPIASTSIMLHATV